MNRSINVFPKLNSELFKAISYTCESEYSTVVDSVEKKLKPTPAFDSRNEVVLLDSEEAPWSLMNSQLIVNWKIRIDNTDSLFGEKGIACKNSEIGVALRWSSKESRQRGVCAIGSLKYGQGSADFQYPHKFPQATLKGSLVLENILYIKECGVPEENETFLGNKKGLVVGELDFLNIRLDGKGSEFPIFEEENNDASNPLWSVYLDWDDPGQSPFVDSFQIYLNKNNPNFMYVDRNSKNYDPYLMNEIVSSALTLLVLKLKEETNAWNEMDRNAGLEEDSVSRAVHYFKYSLNMNFENPVSIHESFRRYFDMAGRK